MATCQDLINVMGDINVSILALNVNVDALRQAVLCQTEFLQRAMVTREYMATYMSNQVGMQAETIEAVTASLNQVARVLSRSEVPPAYQKNLVYIAPGDLGSFEPCSINTYCPPGKIRNEQGECVDPIPPVNP